MRYRNNGQGEDNILQNQFTTYLMTAIRWQKIAYLKKRTKQGKHEFSTDFDSAFAQMLETQGMYEKYEIADFMVLALLHDIGRHEQYRTGTPHELASARIAPDILADCGYGQDEIREIGEAIALHRDGETGLRQDLAGILYRADKASRACFACRASGQCNWKEDRKNQKILL